MSKIRKKYKIIIRNKLNQHIAMLKRSNSSFGQYPTSTNGATVLNSVIF